MPHEKELRRRSGLGQPLMSGDQVQSYPIPLSVGVFPSHRSRSERTAAHSGRETGRGRTTCSVGTRGGEGGGGGRNGGVVLPCPGDRYAAWEFLGSDLRTGNFAAASEWLGEDWSCSGGNTGQCKYNLSVIPAA